MANLQTLSQRAFSRYEADSLPIGRSKTERHRTRRGTSGRCQSPAWLVGNRPPKSSLESAAATRGLVHIIGHTVTLRPLRPGLKFLHSRSGLRRPNILDLYSLCRSVINRGHQVRVLTTDSQRAGVVTVLISFSTAHRAETFARGIKSRRW